jgi:hypothetical protein
MSTAQADAIPLFDRAHTASPRGVLLASLLAAIMLLIFCSRELPGWADQNMPELSDVSKTVDDTLEALDLSAPYDLLHTLMQRLSGANFGS